MNDARIKEAAEHYEIAEMMEVIGYRNDEADKAFRDHFETAREIMNEIAGDRGTSFDLVLCEVRAYIRASRA